MFDKRNVKNPCTILLRCIQSHFFNVISYSKVLHLKFLGLDSKEVKICLIHKILEKRKKNQLEIPFTLRHLYIRADSSAIFAPSIPLLVGRKRIGVAPEKIYQIS